MSQAFIATSIICVIAIFFSIVRESRTVTAEVAPTAKERVEETTAKRVDIAECWSDSEQGFRGCPRKATARVPARPRLIPRLYNDDDAAFQADLSRGGGG